MLTSAYDKINDLNQQVQLCLPICSCDNSSLMSIQYYAFLHNPVTLVACLQTANGSINAEYGCLALKCHKRICKILAAPQLQHPSYPGLEPMCHFHKLCPFGQFLLFGSACSAAGCHVIGAQWPNMLQGRDVIQRKNWKQTAQKSFSHFAAPSHPKN